jgi:LPXTG-motif cell wall-anchored protein
MPNADGTCTVPPVVGGEDTPSSNRPATVAGVEQFAGPQPPTAVEQVTGPRAAVGPTGVLPSTGANTLMNALAATGLGLLLAGAATLLLRRNGSQA